MELQRLGARLMKKSKTQQETNLDESLVPDESTIAGKHPLSEEKAPLGDITLSASEKALAAQQKKAAKSETHTNPETQTIASEKASSPINVEVEGNTTESAIEPDSIKKSNIILQVNDLRFTHVTKQGFFAPERTFKLGPISFDMKKGETISIIGNNGSGKTLLAKCLAGVIRPNSGSIEFIDPDAEPGQSKHNHPIRMILQHSSSAMNPAVPVGAMMDNTLRLNSKLDEMQRKEKIDDTLLLVGLLRDHYYYYRHMLSDGQQQRVAIARALLLDPKIIVADEPFAALDPSVRSQTVNLILKLQHELGLGFFFISHNIGIVRHVSDRVLVLDGGQIIEQGITSEVFADPQEALTQKLVQSHFNLVERHFSLL